VSVAVTDTAAQGVELFIVGVDQIQLGKHDGTVVDMLSVPVSVEFSSLTDSALLLQSMKVPVGVYDSASITLDFSNATLVLTGQSTPATIVDEGGAPVGGTLTLQIDLNETAFQVLANRQRMVTFDFDIAQSLVVDPAHNTATLEPIVAVQIDGTDTQLVTFGTLLDVVPSQNSFTATIGSQTGQPLGTAVYLVNNHTIYQIDGVPSAGTTGLALFDLVPHGTPIQVIGEPDLGTSNILARFVIAGRGADDGTADILEGDVIDRLGNPSAGSNVQLVVFGNARNAQTSFFQFGGLFTALVNFANTRVVQEKSGRILDTDALNVGQHVRIYGTLNANVMYANISTAVVREEPVHALGDTISTSTPTSGGPTTVTMQLQQLQLLPQSAFLFPDSGLTPPNPNALTVNADTLASAQTLVSGTPIEVIGFFAPIDDTAQDFVASSVTDLNTAPSLLLVDNKTNGLTVIVVASPTAIVLQISGTAVPGERAIIDHGLAGFFQLPTLPAPSIAPAEPTGTFTLLDKTTGTETIFTTFSSFSSALAQALSQGATLRTFSSFGVYSSIANSVAATKIGVVIQ
jgi:hypothetical protein